MWILRFLTAVLGLFGRGCSPAMMLNLTVPRWGYRVQRDFAYGPAARQRFDLYLPKVLTGPAPIVLFFYGGAFPAARESEDPGGGGALASQSHIVGKRPPMLLAAGANESPEVLESHRKLAGHLRDHASEVEEITYPHTSHMTIMLALAPGFRHRAPLRDDIANFVLRH